MEQYEGWGEHPLPIWVVVLYLFFLGVVAVVVFVASRDFSIALVRCAFGAIGLLCSHLMPFETLAIFAAFAGKMMIFLALYGLLIPLESAITGRIADFLRR